MDQSQDTQELTMDNLIREFQKMNRRLDGLKEHQWGIRKTPLCINPRHKEEEENHSPRDMSTDKKPRPNRFRVTYQRKILPLQQYHFNVKIDFPEFDRRIEPNEFFD